MGTWEFKCWKWWELKESTVHDLVLLVKLHYFWIILLLLIYANGLDFKKENDCPLSSLKHGGEKKQWKKQDFPKRLNFSGLWLDLWMCSRVETRVVHRYAHPGTFAVAAQCSRADFNITACRIISIHRPVRAVSLFSGYAGKLSLSCKALHGDQLQMKTGGNAGRCQDDSKSTLFIIFNLVLHLKAGAFALWSRCASFQLPFLNLL